ncbi:MAG: PhzF family phenazine biosynthesis protein [bacterium]|nr:PhzF family phenazine biosynthesis protein [bacterium]
MKKLRIKQVDAFTKIPFSGNPAGVVTSASGLTVRQMKLIAREMNLSETVYVLPPKSPQANMNIRWFTPASEVDLCGHATIAAFHAMAEEKKYGMNRSGKYKFKIDTRSGILPVQVKIENMNNILVQFGLPVPVYEYCDVDIEMLTQALNAIPDFLEAKYKIAKDKFQLVIPVKSLDILHGFKPNYASVEEICRKTKTKALTVFTTETADKEASVQTRCFVPLLGVNEDPVTGSSLGPLGIYLAEQGIVKIVEGKANFVAEQGDCLMRAGRVNVEFRKTVRGYSDLFIAGRAVTVFEGEIKLE